MGGYAAFVWPAYLISVLVLGVLTYVIWRRGRVLKQRLQALKDAKKTD